MDKGKKIHRYSWDVLPISRDIINRVNMISEHEGHSMVASNFKYQWSPEEDDMIDEIYLTDDDKTEGE